MINSRKGLFTAALISLKAPLIPKIRGQFVEFLEEV